MGRGLYPGLCHVMSCVWFARFSVSSFSRGVVSVCNVSSFEISIPRQYGFVCIDSGFCFSEVGLFWVERVVLRILS